MSSNIQDSWECPCCTFVNTAREITCLMCNTPMKKRNKPPEPASEEPPKKKTKITKTDKSQEESNTKKGKSTKPKKQKPFNKEYKTELAKLESFLLSPAASTETKESKTPKDIDKKSIIMSTQKVTEMLHKYVSNINELFDRRNTCSVIYLIIQTYNNGLPLYNQIPSMKEYTKYSIQYIFYALDSKDKNYSKNDKKVYLKRLAEAFTSCQAGQARELDAIYGSLIGRSLDLRGQILSLVDEQKQRVLDMVTKKFHPDAWEALDPTRQAPHIESAYAQIFGKELGLRGTEGAVADYCMAVVSKTEAKKAEKEFRKLFSAEETIESFIMDVNQQSKDADRVISRDDLAKWAGSDTAIERGFESASIYYYDNDPEDYPEDSKPTEDNEYQPFLSKKVALDLLMKIFGL